jgi:predicted acetyltransferase
VIDVRTARDDDVEAFAELRAQCYGAAPRRVASWAADVRAASLTDRVLLAFERGELVGGLAVWPFGQFWHGRPVPTGGVGTVVVRPESRSRGVARALLDAACNVMRERGEVISILGPATMPVYRGAGWEMAGDHGLRAVPTETLAGLPPTDLRERRATEADHDAIKRVYLRAARARDGMLARPAAIWASRLAPAPGRYCYVVERGNALVGYVVYSQHKREPMHGYHLTVEDIGATDWEAEATLWRHLGAHRAQAAEVMTDAPTDALEFHFPEQRIRDLWKQHWMLRLVDVPGAIKARGFSTAVKASVPISVSDPRIPANSGEWTLDIADGHAELSRGHTAGVAVTINAFAALYSGFRSARQLAAAGLVRDATPEHLDALDGAFAGPRAVLNDDF